MNPPPTRLGAKLAVLAALWIVVFWLTPAPHKQPPRVADASPNTRPVAVDNPPPTAALVIAGPALSEPETEDREAAAPAFTPPPFDLYTVQPDETIEGIARRLLGDGAHWVAIAQMNPSVDPIRLRAGQELRIPADLSNIQGLASGNAPPAAPPELIYVVASNDTLSEIAQKVYGRAAYWQRIQQANADIVNPEGTNLRPGMELRIPTLPADTQD